MRWLLLFLFITGTWAEEWDAQNYPNPTAGQFKECKMRTTANICDPDGVLSESSRYRLDHDLKQLESRTRQDNAHSFCDKKGVTAAMAVARHVKGGSTDAVKRMANDMLRKWTLDNQCQKAIVIVVSTDDMKFWVARDDKVPVYAEEFTEIFMQQKTLFQQSNYQQALTNILQATWEKSLSKAGSPRAPSGSGGRGQQAPGFNEGGSAGGIGGKGGQPFKMPSIPSWVWLALIFVVIPTLCCCLCCYCCCCRSKNGNQNGPASGAMNDGGAQPRSGGGGGMFGNLLRSGGGAAVGSMIGNFISRRGAGGGGGGGGFGGGNRGQGYQGGGAYPSEPQPVYDDNGGQGGGGLYPSVAKKDEGGGGSWA
ncbi:unnamed protein product [Auanema sp. JU1783]|nr:unnamed protein product [Auanema sp. JU1783]